MNCVIDGVAAWRASNLMAAKRAFKAAAGNREKARDLDFAAACELGAGALSAILSGSRRVGEALARKIEARLGLAAGALDRPPLCAIARDPEELAFMLEARELFRSARAGAQ